MTSAKVVHAMVCVPQYRGLLPWPCKRPEDTNDGETSVSGPTQKGGLSVVTSSHLISNAVYRGDLERDGRGLPMTVPYGLSHPQDQEKGVVYVLWCLTSPGVLQ